MGDRGEIGRARLKLPAWVLVTAVMACLGFASAATGAGVNRSCRVLGQAGVQRLLGAGTFSPLGDGPGLAPGSHQWVCTYDGDPDVNPDAKAGMTLEHFRKAKEARQVIRYGYIESGNGHRVHMGDLAATDTLYGLTTLHVAVGHYTFDLNTDPRRDLFPLGRRVTNVLG